MLNNYSQALHYLRCSVPNTKHRYPGTLGLDRQKEILRLLGDPQNKIKVIHLAGTSGKGSTATYLSHLLASHNFKVGLSLSPHLIDIRERFQINNQLISQKEFVQYLNQITPVIEQVKLSKFGKPTFFEILMALSFYIFYKKKVDYAVIETGMGGLLDGSNVVTNPNKVVLITRLGLDHTQILGSNISAIATQKAGIIHLNNPVFSSQQLKSAQKVLDSVAQKNDTSVFYLKPKINIKNIKRKNLFLTYDFSFQDFSLDTLKLNTIALYQVENSALALAVFVFLSQRDSFLLKDSQIRSTLANLRFYGRADLYQHQGHYLILDGAHNPQKMSALVKSLKLFFPNQKFTFLLAFKKRKDFSKMLKSLIPLAGDIIITQFYVTSQDMIQVSEPLGNLTKIFKKNNFSSYQIIIDNHQALNVALATNQHVVVTGSLYLLGDIYHANPNLFRH